MALQSLYKDYFQKSLAFLYPALEIKRGVSVTPIRTHIAWEGHYEPHDRKLVCLYHLRDDKDFKIFERTKLLDNKLFHDFKQVEDTKGVYVFDFSSQKADWDNFLAGQYSKLSDAHKKKIMKFYGSSGHLAYIESFLYPEKYFGMYSDMLRVPVKVLKEVGELCSHPDLAQETLQISIKDLEIKSQLS